MILKYKFFFQYKVTIFFKIIKDVEDELIEQIFVKYLSLY